VPGALSSLIKTLGELKIGESAFWDFEGKREKDDRELRESDSCLKCDVSLDLLSGPDVIRVVLQYDWLR